FLLHDDGSVNVPDSPQLLELLDFDVRAVGKLLTEIAEEFLAEEIRGEKALVPVGDFVGGMDCRLLRQVALQRAQQLPEPLAAPRADRDDLVELGLAGGLLQE